MSDAAMTDLLSDRDLQAGYNRKPVISGVDWSLRPGDIMGLLGANGSGKSTLLRAVTGQLPLMVGRVAIGGADLAKAPLEAKKAFGYAVDGLDLPLNLTGRQYLEMVASIRGCPVRSWPCGDLVERLGYEKWLARPISEYSLGTRMKLSVSAALTGDPPLLILDESLNGLDPVASWQMKQILRELAASGRHAIILSTHVLEVVASLCNCAILLADGQVMNRWDQDGFDAINRRPGDFEAAVMAALNFVPPAEKDAGTHRSAAFSMPVGKSGETL